MCYLAGKNLPILQELGFSNGDPRSQNAFDTEPNICAKVEMTVKHACPDGRFS